MYLAQGPQRSDSGEVEPAASGSQVKHSTTELLHSRLFDSILYFPSTIFQL